MFIGTQVDTISCKGADSVCCPLSCVFSSVFIMREAEIPRSRAAQYAAAPRPAPFRCPPCQCRGTRCGCSGGSCSVRFPTSILWMNSRSSSGVSSSMAVYPCAKAAYECRERPLRNTGAALLTLWVKCVSAERGHGSKSRVHFLGYSLAPVGVSVWVRKKQYQKMKTYEKQKSSKSDDFEDFWQATSFWIF